MYLVNTFILNQNHSLFRDSRETHTAAMGYRNAQYNPALNCAIRALYGDVRKFNTCARSGQIELDGQIVRKY